MTIKYGLNNKILDNSRIILQFSDRKTVFFISEEHTDNILRFIEFKLDSFSSPAMLIHNYDLETEDTIALIYSSIVTNSLINDHVSRLLDTVVIKSHKNGHTLYEIQNHIFHKVSASNFMGISFEIRDHTSEFIKFHGSLPIILTLGIRKR